MSRMLDILRKHLVGSGFACVILTALGSNGAIASENVVYAFQGGSDGALPQGALINGHNGYFFGTTNAGGSSACKGLGCGTIYKLTTDGSESVLYAFQGGSDGIGPLGSLLVDEAGNVFGTTEEGGGTCSCGTVFTIAPDGRETVLYAFQGGADGLLPQGNLARDKSGSLYGVTTQGGNYNTAACAEFGCGTVFAVHPDGTKTTVYAFQGGNDGELPAAGLIMDSSGNLYGTTSAGGGCSANSDGCGTVFKIAPDGSESVLYSFCQQANCADGAYPYASLIMDSAGNLYGTTYGGPTSCNCGTVFELSSGGTESVLYAFKGGRDGSNPEAGLVMDGAGNLYGTTTYGGSTGCHRIGCGTVFKLAPDGTETVLARFGKYRGTFPAAGLLKGPHGILYGTASAGGTNNDGVVFSVKK